MGTVNCPWKTALGVAPPLSPDQDPRPFPGPGGASFSAAASPGSPASPRPTHPLHFPSPATPRPLPVFLVTKGGREMLHEALFFVFAPTDS